MPFPTAAPPRFTTYRGYRLYPDGRDHVKVYDSRGNPRGRFCNDRAARQYLDAVAQAADNAKRR